jgi:hypothetical protein
MHEPENLSSRPNAAPIASATKGLLVKNRQESLFDPGASAR